MTGAHADRLLCFVFYVLLGNDLAQLSKVFLKCFLKVFPVWKSQTRRHWRLMQISSNKWLSADLSFVCWVQSSQQCSLRIWRRIIQGEDEFISYTSQVPTLFLQGGTACFSITFSSNTVVCALLANIREQREAVFTSRSLASWWAASL